MVMITVLTQPPFCNTVNDSSVIIVNISQMMFVNCESSNTVYGETKRDLFPQNQDTQCGFADFANSIAEIEVCGQTVVKTTDKQVQPDQCPLYLEVKLRMSAPVISLIISGFTNMTLHKLWDVCRSKLKNEGRVLDYQ